MTPGVGGPHADPPADLLADLAANKADLLARVRGRSGIARTIAGLALDASAAAGAVTTALVQPADALPEPRSSRCAGRAGCAYGTDRIQSVDH